MAWAQKPLPAKGPAHEPVLVGIDLNATRARAVQGLARTIPRALPLDGTQDALPMVLSLEGRQPQLGRAAAGLCRQFPHLVCLDFLASLGEPREWVAGRHHLDASRAMKIVLERLRTACEGTGGVVLTVPAYLTRTQVGLLPALAEKARLPLLGSVRAPLAAALAAHAAEAWTGLALVLDADDHAVTATTVVADGEKMLFHASQSWPRLNLRAWKTRMLNAVAERCIRQSRRDPRDSASAEQALYEQLEDALDRSAKGKVIELLIQTTNWYQNLLLRPEELVAFCDPLVRQTMTDVQEMLTAHSATGALRAVLVTRAASRLPGLVAKVEDWAREQLAEGTADSDADFGEALLEGAAEPTRVTVLIPDAAALAAHDLAGRMGRSELARGHFELAVPLPGSVPGPTALPPPQKTFRLFSADPES
jgi:molecular chaperone DnaK (HSP70)